MAAADTLTTQGTVPEADVRSEAPLSRAAAPHAPRLVPVAQLLAVVLGVLAIIWNQQQGIDSLRAEFSQAHSEMRAEFSQAHSEMRAEFSQAHSELRAEVTANGQRLARIEGHLGIGLPDAPPP